MAAGVTKKSYEAGQSTGFARGKYDYEGINLYLQRKDLPSNLRANIGSFHRAMDSGVPPENLARLIYAYEEAHKRYYEIRWADRRQHGAASDVEFWLKKQIRECLGPTDRRLYREFQDSGESPGGAGASYYGDEDEYDEEYDEGEVFEGNVREFSFPEDVLSDDFEEDVWDDWYDGLDEGYESLADDFKAYYH